MKVSVVMPVYNSSKYLDESVMSVLNQTFQDFELILVENGSTDNSLEICNSYAKKDNRVIVFHTDDNIGTGAARNIGIEQSTGEYICFIDSDDIYNACYLEKMLNVSKGYDVVICGFERFTETGKRERCNLESICLTDAVSVHEYVAKLFPDGIIGFPWNKLYKTSVIKNNHLMFPILSRLEDGFFNLDFFTFAESCVVITDILYYYRLPPASAVISKHNSDYADLVMILTDTAFEKNKEWGVDAPTDEVYKFCLNELGTCIENTFLSDWGFSRFERKQYLEQMVLMDTYVDAFKHLELIGTYRRMLHKLLNSHMILLLELLVRLKTFGKGKLTWLYYRLKK